MEEGEMTVVLAGLQQFLLKEGLGLDASDCERLAMLWRLYLEKDKSVRMLTEEIQELRAERAAEINTVQQYVENIRSLSRTRDSVALELEQDNEMLRNKLDEISLQQGAQRNEIAEMLLQEGLAEVIPSSLSEQVAYLLAERASLMEKLQAQEGADMNAMQKCAEKGIPQNSNENTEKVVSVRGRSSQSPLRRLLGMRKTAQTKHISSPVTHSSTCGEKASKECERWLLERDLDEASNRLDMAHREIRRLTDELESARLTQRAYEPELQEAQLEVEQLRQEVEKLKRCDVAELRRAKEVNDALDAEVHQLRNRVHRMQTERFQLLELVDRKIEDLDNEDDEVVQNFFQKLTKGHVLSTDLPSKDKTNKDKDVHQRCCAELQDLKQSSLKLQAELGEEEVLRKKAVEECDDQSQKRAAAEQLILEVQALCEQKEEDHKAEVQELQEKLVSLNTEVDQLKSSLHKEREKARQQHAALQTQTDQTKAQTQHAEAQFRQLNDELKTAQDLLNLTNEELLTESERNGQLQRNISLLEQEKLKVAADLQKALSKVTQLEQNDASRSAELQNLQQKLQIQQTQWEQDKSLLQQELKANRVQITSLEQQVKDLQQQLKSATQQLRVEEAQNAQNSRLVEKVRDMLEELDTLKIQAEDAQKHREHLAEREMDLQQQVQTLLTINSQLSLAKTELSRVQDQQSKKQNDLRQIIAKLEHSLMCSQQEIEKLQIQLQEAHCNLQSQISKFQDKKDRHKEKLGEAKEVYLRETAWRDEKIKEQDRELRVLMKKIEKEREMVKKVTAENEALLLNRKQLLYQLNEEEESRKHAVAEVTSMKQRVDFLEKDGVQQRDFNMMKSKQIAKLEGLLHDKQIITKDFKNLCSFENRIIEGSDQASSSEQGFETFDLVEFIPKTKSKPTDDPGALNQSRVSEMVYLT
ncbi:CAP-Gly domain-containing linker protein 1 isoform X1 [Astyanax mexicanus]|uniref:CAP-Gly domain-containing linker protein 1 isoform X1 n=1 Tax=Astyanax mexicanus TaxID=7994 RepID=UPI0020CB3347|nr:CAP-Gly domain-containing linker protein 1 isoform X1 [Astyanax mexicanus]